MTFVMCVAEAFSMASFAAYATLLPLFQKAWGLSNTEAGLIGGIAFAGYMTAVPVLLAMRVKWAAHSRTWATEPGALVSWSE